MIRQHEIPFLFMRGGTSRGPYFNAADLPKNRDDIARILLRVIGAGHPLNIDGIGGGNQVTNKVAILSRSDNKETDIDYLFAQVSVADQLVDFKPTCGNTHSIEVDSDSAKFSLRIENVQSENNPGTGKITALSVIACLRGMTAPLKVGS